MRHKLDQRHFLEVQWWCPEWSCMTTCLYCLPFPDASWELFHSRQQFLLLSSSFWHLLQPSFLCSWWLASLFGSSLPWSFIELFDFFMKKWFLLNGKWSEWSQDDCDHQSYLTRLIFSKKLTSLIFSYPDDVNIYVVLNLRSLRNRPIV